MNAECISVPGVLSLPRARILPRIISGIQLIPTEDKPGRLGLVTQLPQNAELELCGDGFDERTVKVRWLGTCYFVFRQDLEILSAEA